MISDWIDTEDSHIVVKLIDGSELWGISLCKKSAQKDFGVKVTDGTIVLYEPCTLHNIQVQDKITEKVSVLTIPSRYFDYDMSPFVEIDYNKIMTIHNMDETAEEFYDTCAEYLYVIDNSNIESLNNSKDFLESQIIKSNQLDHKAQLDALDEDEATAN